MIEVPLRGIYPLQRHFDRVQRWRRRARMRKTTNAAAARPATIGAARLATAGPAILSRLRSVWAAGAGAGGAAAGAVRPPFAPAGMGMAGTVVPAAWPAAAASAGAGGAPGASVPPASGVPSMLDPASDSW